MPPAPAPAPARPSPAATRPRLASLAGPLFVELGLGLVVGLVGTLLAARVSDTAAAGFALANQLFTMLFVCLRVVGAGLSVVVAQNLGGGRRDGADRVARASLGAASGLGGALALLAFAGAEPMLRALNAPATVLPLAVPLLQALAPVVLLDAWNATLASVMRAHLRGRELLAVMVAMHSLHVVLALAAMPALGLVGFALALAASRVLGVGLHLWLWRRRLGLVPRWRDAWTLRRDLLAEVLRIGVPSAAEHIIWRLGFIVSVAAAGQLGAVALATQAYALQVAQVVMLATVASGVAVEVLVSRLVGAGRLHEAHRLVRRTLARGLLMSVGAAALAALAGPWLLALFSQEPQVRRVGLWLLWGGLLLESGRCFNIVLINALRATGDARFPVVAGSASVVVVLAGGSWLFGVGLGWGLPGIWAAYIADEWIRGLIMAWRWSRRGWVPAARAAHRRLRHTARLDPPPPARRP